MTLPEVCPLDENQKCKGRECHLFCLEWRTREPTCLIGYSTTSKVKSWKDDRKQDTYAAETFRKLGRQPVSRKKSVSEKGDWIPTRLAENPQEKPALRKEISVPYKIPQKIPQKPSVQKPVVSHPAEEKTIIYGRTQPKVQEKPKVTEKVISSNKHTTIFSTTDKVDEKDTYLSGREERINLTGREERINKPQEDKEKRKKLDKVMEIDTPEVKDEEFWS